MQITTKFNQGGNAIVPKRGRSDGGTSNLVKALRDIAEDLQRINQPGAGTLRVGGVLGTPLLSDPSTGSSQLTGTGNTDWNVNIAAFVCTVGGVGKEFAAAADFDIHSGSYLTGFANGSSCIAAIVAKNVSGTVTTVAVTGTPATTGSQVAPTDAEIQTALGATVPWVKVGECTLNRTADTTVTETQDNTLIEPGLNRNYTVLTTEG